MSFGEALAYLDDHASYERTGRVESPSLERIAALCVAAGDPQHTAPVIHVTGTNGKGSTTQIITRLLMAMGLNVGTYSSPHLEHVGERIQYNAEPIGEEDFAAQIAAVADLEVITGIRPTYFEAVTLAAFRWFADIAVDVMVVEVGLLGRWDATNVVDATVAVITNIGLDHTELAGPTLADIAAEKAGIIKPRSAVVVGETDPALVEVFRGAGGASMLLRGEDFDVVDNRLAVGGRLVDVRTPTTVYPDLFLPLHGAHQGDNLAVAMCAAEAFFAAPLSGDVVGEALAAVRMPGRFEVVGHEPLVIIDGAHNPAGADCAAAVFFDDFAPAGRRLAVVGCLRGRDPIELLGALRADEFDQLFVCPAPSPRGLPAADLLEAARQLGCDDVSAWRSVEAACDAALGAAREDDALLVTGSLYVVGAARPYLRRRV